MTGTNSKVCDVVPSPIHYHYRSKITPHFNKPKNGKIGPIGFQQYGRRSLVDIDSCEIAKKDINTSLKKIRDDILEKASSYKKGATILIRSDINDQIHTSSDSIAEEVVEDIKFHFTAGSFFKTIPLYSINLPNMLEMRPNQKNLNISLMLIVEQDYLH